MLASTIRKFLTPYTCNCGFTTAVGSELGPILQVPTYRASKMIEHMDCK